VQILGDQSAIRAGPPLFTKTFPPVLLQVGADRDPSDGVRITGIRLDGGESDDPFSAVGKDDADGIAVFSSRDVEIDHNELYRWRGAAVNVHDGNSRINRDNASTVRVHDNYIHHNQHPSSDTCESSLIGGGHAAGYGVVATDGAYVLIERNVFDWNRHSIAGDGKAGTGYLAFRNLILQHGGVHFRCVDTDTDVLGGLTLLLGPFGAAAALVTEQVLDSDSIYHTHAIDMHAINTCHHGVFVGDGLETTFGDHNCGPAGEFMDIEFNTVLYTVGNGIHLRGTPTIGMDVKHNVFAHHNHDGGFLTPGAMLQNETGLHDSDNIFALDTFNNRRSCDFDGDGITDPFIATGVTFWYASSMLGGRWVFLAQSPALVDEVTLGDFDGDGRCDVAARGQVFLNPGPLPFARNPGNVSTVLGRPATLSLIATGGTRPYSWTVTGLPPGLSANPAGQISGTPAVSAGPSYWVTATVWDANHQFTSIAFNWSVTAMVPNVLSEQPKDATSEIRDAGLTVGRVSYTNNCVDPGSVMIQHPTGGSTAAIGSPVDITLSKCDSGGDHRGGGTLPK
jgi:Putative Ig domain/PASTA domain/Right handed beta helix region